MSHIQLKDGNHLVVTGFGPKGDDLPNMQLEVYASSLGARLGCIDVPNGKEPLEVAATEAAKSSCTVKSSGPNSFDVYEAKGDC